MMSRRTNSARMTPPAPTPAPARLVVEAAVNHAGMRRGEQATVDAGDPAVTRRLRRGYLRLIGVETPAPAAPVLALVAAPPTRRTRKAVTGVHHDQSGQDHGDD